jgi:inorganic pyrophosphatase
MAVIIADVDYSKPFLGKSVHVKIDRPAGSKHPRHGHLYPINYGFVPGTKAPDGGELDAYVLGITEPLDDFTGTCIAIIHRTNDNDDKLIVCQENQTFTDDQIREQTNFQEQWFESVIIRPTSPETGKVSS